MDPDQDRQNVGPDLDPNCLSLSDSVLERTFFGEVNFINKSGDKKSVKSYLACTELLHKVDM